MTTLSALYCAKNEEDFIEQSIRLLLPYVDEVIVVDNASTDRTRAIVEAIGDPKIKVFEYPETQDMGEVRTFSLSKATSEWFLQVDADEFYPREAMETIRKAIENPGKAISFRVGYHNLAWRAGYKQADFKHFPDRIYRVDVVKKYGGILPNDMTQVKAEFCTFRPFLEYDNAEDKPFENPKQPILDAYYFHLARTRGRNFEYKKWLTYNRNLNPERDEEWVDMMTRKNHWVSGQYAIEKIEVPEGIPTLTIPRPKVSVIIPNFQYAEYIGKAIESAMNQTVKPYEIIVVDDGSHDNSIEVIEQYPVRLLKMSNGGVAAARNAGTSIASGDYLLFLDADDELSPFYIEETLKEMTGDTQVVYTDMQFIGDQTGVVGMPEPTLENMLGWQCVPSVCALVDVRAFNIVGGFDNGEIFEDWGFWLRMMHKGFTFKKVSKPLFKYRKHGFSRNDITDSNQTEGFEQLRMRYGITREPDKKREAIAKQLCKENL